MPHRRGAYRHRRREALKQALVIKNTGNAEFPVFFWDTADGHGIGGSKAAARSSDRVFPQKKSKALARRNKLCYNAKRLNIFNASNIKLIRVEGKRFAPGFSGAPIALGAPGLLPPAASALLHSGSP